MITVICGMGAVAVLVCALIRGLDSTVRGLVSWTFSSLAAVLSMAVYFSQNRFTLDFPALLFALGGIGIMAVIIMLIEFFAPSGRFKKHAQEAFDVSRSEAALNLVMIIITAVLASAAAAGENADMLTLSGLCLIPAAAISIRQLSYHLHLAKRESLQADSDEKKRLRLMRGLGDSTGNKL